MIKICFICNWGESSDELLKRYSKQTPKCLGIWGDLIGVENPEEADYYIVLEGTTMKLPIERTIFIKREPNYIAPNSSNKYLHNICYDEHNTGVTYWLNKTYDELMSLEYPKKNKLISCIVSSKHSHRNKFLKKLFNSDNNVHLYGRGHDESYYGESYKGELNYDGNCKFNGLIDYTYTIVMENSSQKNYWTEKLADAYLSWCVPIYWGCPNIIDFFPDNSYHLIDINHGNPIDEINKIIDKPVDVEVLNKARNLILDEYNIWEVINKKIKNINKDEILQSVWSR